MTAAHPPREGTSFLFTSLNAELGRNLLKELTLHRLIAPPVILMLLYFVNIRFDQAGLDSHHSYWLSSLTGWILFAALLLWGCRRAAASVLEEVDERTWDFQRLAQLSPVQLATGKLLGSTAYGWYIALWALALQVVMGQSLSAPEWGKLTAWLLGGFSGQAAALLMALVSVPERRRGYKGLGIGLCQLTGVLYGVMVYTAYQPVALELRYFGLTLPYLAFYWLNACVFLGWLLAGCVRLMRRELQYPCYPWVWTAYLLYLAVHLFGISPLPPEALTEGRFGIPLEMHARWQEGLAIFASWKPYLLLIIWSMLGFWSLLAEDKNPKLFRELGYHARYGRLRSLLHSMPGWLIAVGLSVLLALWLYASGSVPLTGEHLSLQQMAQHAPALALASILFLLRDIGVIWWFFLAPKPGRAMLGAFVYLFVLYAILPWILGLMHAPDGLMGFFVPWSEARNMPLLWPVLVECIGLFWLLRWRYRRLFDDRPQ